MPDERPEMTTQCHTMRDTALPEAINSLRTEIDRLDDALLELVEQRLAASMAMAALKQREGSRFLNMRPKREQAVIDRLAARARQAPPEVITQIWRTVMSHSLQAQVRTELVLCSSGDKAALLQQVRTRFGDAAPIRWASEAAEALDAARSGEAVAVIEPQLLDPAAVTAPLFIFDALRDRSGATVAMAAGRVAPEDAMDPAAVRESLS